MNIISHIRELLVRRHQARRAQDERIAAALQVRELLAEQRRSVLQSQLDEPGYIELGRPRGAYRSY